MKTGLTGPEDGNGMTDDLIIRAERIVTPDGIRSGEVRVSGGRIRSIEAIGSRGGSAPDAGGVAPRTVVLAEDEVLLPGVVDTHVHVNEPGREHWEGFVTATQAAVAGGVTTIVDMPLNALPPTLDVGALRTKQSVASGRVHVDVGFWGGATPGNIERLAELHRAGVYGFKCFLSDSGVEEFPALTAEGLAAAMREIASFDGLLLVHAEDEAVLEAAPAPHGRDYEAFVASRPGEAERRAVELVVETARATGCRVHIVHVSSAEVLPVLAAARADGVRISAETCPHYLRLAAERVPEGDTRFKCCPPIRDDANRELLWAALRDGVIPMIASDHSPSTIEAKMPPSGDFGAAWGGISSLQLALPAVWTEAVARGFGLDDVVRWMSAGPADLVGMDDRGAIEAGRLADFCVFAPDEEFSVDARGLRHKNQVTAYDGSTLRGVVRSTWLRGERIEVDGEPRGSLMERGASR